MMLDWNFTPNHPISLTLVSDARLTPTSYTNDHIWEFKVGNTEPPAISLETSFGLRARLCRIFPRFIYKGKEIADPAHFSHPITIHHYYPNYIYLSFKPFSSINVKLEYWVPSSQAVAGRMKIRNTSHETCEVELQWAEILLPSTKGSGMTAEEVDMNSVLTGSTADLVPVLIMTGVTHPGISPYCSLNASIFIPPNGEHVVQMAQATLSDMSSSYSSAKEILKKNWDAEFSRIDRVNSRLVHVQTGNKEWDSAFFLSQNISNQLVIKPDQCSDRASIVFTRTPGQGFSLLGDGSDYNHLWNGPTPLEAYYLAEVLLPGSPGVIKSLIENFLAAQTANGEIDLKPGLGGQRSQLLATPILATLSLKLAEHNEDVEYLTKIFPKLLAFFNSWFTKKHDRDSDQLPEWDQVLQTGFEALPLFSQNYPWSLGTDISTVEGPDLYSYLYRESMSLQKIARIIHNPEALAQLEAIAASLKSAVEQSWSDSLASYLYRDRDSHLSPPAEALGTIKGPGIIEIHREFTQPIRPVITIDLQGDIPGQYEVFIHGTSSRGRHRVEHIPVNSFHWHLKSGYYTSRYVYQALEHIEVIGTQPGDKVNGKSVDIASIDQSLLLPLWAQIPAADRAESLINLTIMNKKKFLSPYGLSACINLPGIDAYPEDFYGIHLPWISLILDGLVAYGERKKAAELFTRFMKAVIQSTENDLTLRQSYHSETGKGLGLRNPLTGIIPIGTFLNILGVKIFHSNKIEISGQNPFPWAVTLKFKGLTVIRQAKKTVVTFPDGQSTTIENDQRQMISREGKK